MKDDDIVTRLLNEPVTVGLCNDAAEYIAARDAEKPLDLKFDADGQAWIVANAGEGRRSMINLNNIFLSHSPAGITRGILLDALAKSIPCQGTPTGAGKRLTGE